MKKFKYIIIIILTLILVGVFIYLMKPEHEKKAIINIKKNEKTSQVIKEKEKYEFKPIDPQMIYKIINENKTSEISEIEKKFEEAPNSMYKSLYVSMLLRLGDEDDKYFEYLEDQAKQIIEDDRPYLLAKDANGKDIKGQISPEFEDWCSNKDIEINICISEWVYSIPAITTYLGLSGDERFFVYLEAALNSSSEIKVRAAANGLGLLGDKRAIPLFAQVLKNTNKPFHQHKIALPLYYFNDSGATELAEEYIIYPKEAEYYKKEAKEGKFNSLLIIF